MDFISEQMRDYQRKQREIQELKDDMALITNDIFNAVVEELDDVAPYFDTNDLIHLIKKLLKADHDIFKSGDPNSMFSALDTSIKKPNNARAQKDAIDTRIDKILLPYATNAFKDKGIYQFLEFETGTITMKTQTQETPAHKAAKLDFIHADEPMRKATYNECLSRLLDRKGTIWSTLTPVIDAKSSALRAAEIVWYKKDIIDPYLRNPDAFPLRDVIFLPIEENARWTDVEFAKDLFRSMSREEQNVRLSGMPIDFIGDNLFNLDMVKELEDFLKENFEISQPEVGVLVYDDKETDDDLRIQEANPPKGIGGKDSREIIHNYKDLAFCQILFSYVLWF